MNCVRWLQASVVVNIIAALLLAYFIRKPSPAQDNSVADLAAKNAKTIEDLRGQLLVLNEEKNKAADAHRAELQKAASDYEKKIAEITAGKRSDASDIVKKYDKDMPGLAKDFSRTMGLSP